MHELGIMTGVLESAEEAAKNAGADKVLKISLSVGVMTEAIEDVLRFAFDALSEGTIFEGCELEITMIQPVSICLDCGNEFEHDRFHMTCPECGSPFLQLIQGKELRIDSIEVDVPDKDELSPSNANAEQEA
ncbi:MAG: hydrogenase maturation nickel metallochaperone HypA [Eggerthellaceae bacterium]